MGLFKKNKKTKDTNELEFVGEINKEKIQEEYTGLEFSEDDDEISIPNKKNDIVKEKSEKQILTENKDDDGIEEDNQSDLDFQIPHPMITQYNYILDLESRLRIIESEMSILTPAYAELVTMYNSLVKLLEKYKLEDNSK